jgi:hypothetical protein
MNKIKRTLGQLLIINKKILHFISDGYYLNRQEKLEPGTKEWFIATEIKYGGFITNVARKKVSPNDPRTKKQIKIGGMTGGDRMNFLHNNYAPLYERALSSFCKEKKPDVLIEVGILEGTGVAIWSDLFKESRIIGLDIDLSHISNNMQNLKEKGAFKNKNLELYEFDQYANNEKNFLEILNGDKIDVFIDDGCHTIEAIMLTLKNALQFLNNNFIYIVEDNTSVHKIIKEKYPQFKVWNKKNFTVISKKQIMKNE